jgi:glutamate 5-kinase
VRSAPWAQIRRLVVKLGTGILTDHRNRPDQVQFAQLVAQVAALREAGKDVVIVSSGAVGAGMGALGFERRPRDVSDLQACAAIGQLRLMTTYEALFRHHGLGVAQVLLTHEDLADHRRHLNARNTLLTLMRRGVVPIINENDAVSVTELKFGDNDRLSALVASLLPADLLVILTTAEGLIENFGRPDARRVSVIETIDPSIIKLAGGTQHATAIGGMITKIEAARIVARAGIPMVIASGRKFDVLSRIVAGGDEGSLFVPRPEKLTGRKRWIAFYHRAAGALTVDDGARRAIGQLGRSLLRPGVVRVEGDFASGSVVSVCDSSGCEFARGLSRWSTAELRAESGSGEVIHRDDLVLL